MPTYPALAIFVASRPSRRDGRKITRAVSGTARARDFYGADKLDFLLEHRALSATDLGTLADFYAANRNGTFDLYWPPTATTYTGLMFDENGYQDRKSEAVGRFDVTVRLTGA
jgi:hypothetical protein